MMKIEATGTQRGCGIVQTAGLRRLACSQPVDGEDKMLEILYDELYAGNLKLWTSIMWSQQQHDLTARERQFLISIAERVEEKFCLYLNT